MRHAFIRVIISVVAGFLLMWPLSYVYSVLGWPTFNSWALMHGGFLAAWPTLAIFTFLSLGYVRLFPRFEDTPLLIAGLTWGLLLSGYLGFGGHLGVSATYGLLTITAVIVAMLVFFARHKLGLTLLVVAPIVFLNMQFLLIAVMSARMDASLLDGAVHAFHEVKRPLVFALIGWGLGSLSGAILRRPPVAM